MNQMIPNTQRETKVNQMIRNTQQETNMSLDNISHSVRSGPEELVHEMRATTTVVARRVARSRWIIRLC